MSALGDKFRDIGDRLDAFEEELANTIISGLQSASAVLEEVTARLEAGQTPAEIEASPPPVGSGEVSTEPGPQAGDEIPDEPS